MLLVTGGLDSGWEKLASTEVYRPSAGEWREVPGGALPRPMTEVRVVTLNNRVLLFGEKIILTGWHNNSFVFKGGEDKKRYVYAEILEYSNSEEKWISTGKMSKKRDSHAVSIIDFYEFEDHCQ